MHVKRISGIRISWPGMSFEEHGKKENKHEGYNNTPFY